MTIEIRNRQGEIIISGEYDSIKSAAEANSGCLENADFKNADLSNACLSGANLAHADLRGADLICAELDGAVLRNVLLSEAFLDHADLREAELNDADLRDTYCGNAFMDGASFVHANMSRAVMPNCSLSESDMQFAVLESVDLTGANLQSANLAMANLSHANLAGADLSRAILSDAIFTHANLSGADFTWAFIMGTNLHGANLSSTVMTNVVTEIPDAKAVRCLLRSAFTYGNTSDMTHDDFVELRCHLVALIAENVHSLLPPLLEEILDSRTNGHEGMDYADMLVMMLDGNRDRFYSNDQFRLFAAAQSYAVYQWLLLALTWDDDIYRDYTEPAIVYWRERAAHPDHTG